MPDKIVFKESGTEIEFPEEPAIADDLADLLFRLRNVESVPTTPHLSDAAIRSLLTVAFYLSMCEDEGRFPRLRVISGNLDDHRLAAKFTTPVRLDDVHELRRLTPAASATDFALLAAESEDGSLRCPGLANIGRLGLGSQPGRPEILPVGGPPSIIVWIEGPGHLFVQHVTCSFEYRAGRVRLMRPIMVYPEVRELTETASKDLFQRALDHVSDVSGAEQYFGGQFGLAGITNTMLTRLLSTCIEQRHGGAFIFVPEGQATTDAFGIECKYPLQSPDLGEVIAQYWASNIRASSKKDKAEFASELSRCNHRKARLLTNVDAVSKMSGVDGCVVLTKQLGILGFGGKILVSEDDCMTTGSKFKLSCHEPCEIDRFLGSVGGQRHQSAARAVIKHEHILAFVVSQDAEMSLFARDKEGFVRAYRPIDPSFTPQD